MRNSAENEIAPTRRGLASYLAWIRACPTLTREEEARLAADARRGGKDSIEKLVCSNLAFVVKAAREFTSFGVPLDDLINAGNLGLVEAVQRYDASRGTRFITYAVWWVRKAILRELEEQIRLVRIPDYRMRKIGEIRDADKELSRKLGRRPTRQEVSERLPHAVSAMDHLYALGLRVLSLDEKRREDDTRTLSDSLVNSDVRSPEEGMIVDQHLSMILRSLERLTRQERAVLSLRFGLGGEKALSLKKIGDRMNLSHERVRQIEKAALIRLRGLLEGNRRVNAPSKGPRPVQRVPPSQRL